MYIFLFFPNSVMSDDVEENSYSEGNSSEEYSSSESDGLGLDLGDDITEEQKVYCSMHKSKSVEID